ncbi:cell division protein FtsQ/DivIB [Thalassobius aquimarinus]|uniref:Cell division protein FtsQ n=2 Tax=Thalassovita aquimarina TaxID=2785917 RepID=A0ABS5HT15_9RHOB|nr:cell division protein FtsQ/DivIB [Thalassovita aquimarina]
MLTPLFRTLIRVGLPLTAAFVGAMIYFSQQDNRDALRLWLVDIRNEIQTRPEFMVKLMAIDGAGTSVAEDIREITPIDFPVSSFDLDLDNMRATIAELPAVRDVSIRVRPGGVLQVDVVERVPAILWRDADGVALLDEHGFYVRQAGARADHAELPLIAGDGADRAVPEALALFRAAGPLRTRLRGLVRIGERRWDLVLDRGQRILLPENQPVQALERVIALHQAQDVMARDLAMVDMRIGSRPTIRMNEAAVEQWWQINKIGFKD